MTPIEQLQAFIQQHHGCGSTLLESVHICEERGGRVIWEGDVHVFSLQGHQRARRCYAWQHTGTADNPHFVAILAVGHIDSARAAVRAAMVDESRRQGE
ncbi:MAG: hypothetical protein IT445_11840 [Phycisphaeraceae bacterium]|nr:hypothetical protein [Phycisphaeraceae bacterium]